jgi:hypothetical protein
MSHLKKMKMNVDSIIKERNLLKNE